MMLDLMNLPVGSIVRLKNGAIVRVIENAEDGMWITGEYLYPDENPGTAESIEMIFGESIAELVPPGTEAD